MNINKNSNRSEINSKYIRGYFSDYYLYISFLIIIIISSFISPIFLNSTNIINVLLQNSIITILAIGQLFVIITGGIDLSVGSIVALSSLLVADFLKMGFNPIFSVIVVLALMAMIGVITGFLICYGKAAPFIVTFSMMSMIRGLAYMYQTGSDFRINNDFFIDIFTGQVNGLYLPIIYMFSIAFIMYFILKRTVFGRIINAIGGSRETCVEAGIKVNYFIIASYLISAVLASFGGIILAARLSMGTALVGTGYELDAIASVLIGGIALSGGNGSVLNTVIGAFIMGIINNILNLTAIPTYPQMFFKGLIILVAVLANRKKE